MECARHRALRSCRHCSGHHTPGEARVDAESVWRRAPGRLLLRTPLFCHTTGLCLLCAPCQTRNTTLRPGAPPALERRKAFPCRHHGRGSTDHTFLSHTCRVRKGTGWRPAMKTGSRASAHVVRQQKPAEATDRKVCAAGNPPAQAGGRISNKRSLRGSLGYPSLRHGGLV